MSFEEEIKPRFSKWMNFWILENNAKLYDKAFVKDLEEFATDICKEQIELCAEALAKELFFGEIAYDDIPIIQTIKNTPLATEVTNE